MGNSTSSGKSGGKSGGEWKGPFSDEVGDAHVQLPL